ncbi:MAG: hypothetical protein FWE43_01945 [Streptococcaceae bacterium]|nr:hypothetical protein [Streptococcaceae bacterium]MCL2681231.1 hypothetical protein [Streptococcaceae bacterium]
MGLTFKKRDDFEKIMKNLGVATPSDEQSDSNEEKVDPFAKFLESSENNKENQ